MSALLISCMGDPICYWKGETPAIGDLIWVEAHKKIFLVDTVIRPIGIAQGESGSEAYPVKMIKIIVQDMTDEYKEESSIPRILEKLSAQGY